MRSTKTVECFEYEATDQERSSLTLDTGKGTRKSSSCTLEYVTPSGFTVWSV